MSLAPEAVQLDHNSERKHPESAAREAMLQDTSLRPLAGAFSALGGDGSGESNAKLGPLLQRRASGEMRMLIMRCVQQGAGNHQAQHFVARLRLSSLIQRECSCGGSCSACQKKAVVEEEPTILQRQASSLGAGGGVVDASVIPADSPGQPLDSDTRAFMEPRFGSDFSDVRVHTDTRAAQSADALAADAYTSNADIFFAAGRYAPQSKEGQHLLAHELTHTVQQKEGKVPSSTRAMHAAIAIGHPRDPLEKEAEQIADHVTGNGAASSISPDRTPGVRRQSSGFWDTKLGRFVSGAGREASSVAEGLGQGLKAGLEKGKAALAEVIETYAPGVLPFLLNLKNSIADRASEGLDSLFGGLAARIRKEGFGSALLNIVSVLIGGIAPALGKLMVGACSALPAVDDYLSGLVKEFGGKAIADLKGDAARIGEFFSGLMDEYGAPAATTVRKILGGAWTNISRKVQEYWAKLLPLRTKFADAWDWFVKAISPGKITGDGFLEDLFVKAVEKWQDVKKTLQPYMKYVKQATAVLLLISLFGPMAPLIVAAHGLYTGIKSLWESHGQKLETQLRHKLVTSVLPSIVSAADRVKRTAEGLGRWLSGVVQDLAGLGKALLESIGVLPLLRLLSTAMAALSDRWNKFSAQLNTTLTAWTAKIGEACLATIRFLHPLLEFFRQTLLVTLFGPFAILDDGVWNTTKKIVTLALTVPCIREIGGLLRVPLMFAQVERMRGMMKAVWALIKNPDPVIRAIHDALAPMVNAVPGLAAMLVAANVFPEEPEHQRGVQLYLAPLLQYFRENWWDEIKKIGWTILWPWDEVGKSFPVFFASLSGAVGAVFDLEFNQAIDKGLKSLQALNGVLGAVSGWFVLASVLVGAALGALGVEFSGGATIAAGAAAGWGVGQTVGLALLAAAAATEVVIMEKAKFDLRFTNKAAGDKVRTFLANQKSYETIAGNIFSMAMMGAMVLLGALIHAAIKEVKAAVRGPEAPKIAPGETPAGEGLSDPDSTAKPGDFSPEDISRSKGDLQQKVKNPQNVKPVTDPKLAQTYDAEVKLDDDSVARRNRKTGTWCFFRNPSLCVGEVEDVNPAVDGAIEGKDPLQESPASRIRQIEERYGRVLENFDARKWRAFKEQLQKLSPAEASRQLALLEKELFNRAIQSIVNERNLTPEQVVELRKALEVNPDKIADFLDAKQPLLPDPDETPTREESGKGGAQPVETGKAGVDWSRADAVNKFGEVVINDEIAFKVKTSAGVIEVRLDLGSIGPDSLPRGIEAKNGFGADLNAGQRVAYPVLATEGGVPANPRAVAFAMRFNPNWQPGDPIPGFRIRVDYWIDGKRVGTAYPGGSAPVKAVPPVSPHPQFGPVRVIVLSRALIQRQCNCGGACESCRGLSSEVDDTTTAIQRQGSSGASAYVAEADIVPADSPGYPVDRSARSSLERQFAADLSDVRVHTDNRAQKSAQALTADAYTSGRHIYFAAGKYSPATDSGRRLLAHETAHVMQQRAGMMPTVPTSQSGCGVVIGAANDPLEVDARIAERNTPVKSPGEHEATPTRLLADSAQPLIQRAPDGGTDAGQGPPSGRDPEVGKTADDSKTGDDGSKQTPSAVPAPEPTPPEEEVAVTIDGIDVFDDEPYMTRRVERLWIVGGYNQYSGFMYHFQTSDALVGGTLEANDRIRNMMERIFDQLEKQRSDFVTEFGEASKAIARETLDHSEAEAKIEADRYGIKLEFITSQISDCMFGSCTTTTVTYSMPERTATFTGLQGAAQVLLDRRRDLDAALAEADKAITEEMGAGEGAGAEEYSNYAELNQQLGAKVKKARDAYDLMRGYVVGQYPILASFSTPEESTDELESVANRENGPDMARLLGGEIVGRLKNIDKVRAGLKDGDVNVWRLHDLVHVTAIKMGLESPSLKTRWVEQEMKDEEPSVLASIALALLNIGAILLAAPTGGASLVAVAAIDAVGVLRHLNEYMMQKALTGTAFDKAQALSQEEPSLFWLAVEVVGFALDASAAFKAVAATVEALKAAKAAGDTARVTAELENLNKVAKVYGGEQLATRVAAHLGEEATTEGQVLKALNATSTEKELLAAGTHAVQEELEAGALTGKALSGKPINISAAGRIYSCHPECEYLLEKYKDILGPEIIQGEKSALGGQYLQLEQRARSTAQRVNAARASAAAGKATPGELEDAEKAAEALEAEVAELDAKLAGKQAAEREIAVASAPETMTFEDELTGEFHEGIITDHGLEICSPRPCPIVSAQIKDAAQEIRTNFKTLEGAIAPQVESELTRMEQEAMEIDANTKALYLDRETQKLKIADWEKTNPGQKLPDDLAKTKLDLKSRAAEINGSRRNLRLRMARLPGTIPVRAAVRDAFAPRLAKLGLSEEAMERIFAKAPVGDHMKGQLLEELLNLEVAKTTKVAAKGVVTSIEESSEFIAGDRVSLGGRKFSDGLILTRRGGKLYVTSIFEAKAGSRAAKGLLETNPAAALEELSGPEFREMRSEALESLRAERPDFQQLSLDEIWEHHEVEVRTYMEKELLQGEAGQFRRDIERLVPNAGEEVTTIKVDGVPMDVIGSPRTSHLTGVTASGTSIEPATVKELQKQGLRLTPRQLAIPQARLDELAVEMEKAAKGALPAATQSSPAAAVQ
ncbi:DUF4157 domain-containing protein [Tunturibacter psychrotolerans]|uniref:DUF4157 domain-containing protein n=1 Tax=Tunturiibacter psychrotolerans TaxID=3069686 RepID=A0AAU7ZRL7_9BACT